MKKSRKIYRILAIVILIALSISLMGSCGNGGGGATTSSTSNDATSNTAAADNNAAAPSDRTSIRVGIVAPFTGEHSRFTISIQETADRSVKYMNEVLGGYDIGPYKNLPVEIIWGDSESNEGRAAEVADWLCTTQNIDVLVGTWAPPTFVPTAVSAERHGVPCFVNTGPVEAYVAAGPFKWVFGAHFDLQTAYNETFIELDRDVPTNKKVGLLFDNSHDGLAHTEAITAAAEAYGYEVIDPGRFPQDTTDYTAILTSLKEAGADIVSTVNGTPGLITVWNTMQQLDYRPPVLMFHMGMHFTEDALSLGGEWGAVGVSNHPQWALDMDYTSSLTGHTSAELNQFHIDATGTPPDLVIGWDQMIFDILHDVFSRTASLDKEDIRQAFFTMDVDTAYGHVKFENGYVKTPAILGQWVEDETWGLAMVVTGAVGEPQLTPRKHIPMPWSVGN